MSTTRNRRHGAKFEIDLLNYLRENGYTGERLRLAGRDDEGDLVVFFDGVTILEAKATKALDTASGVRQAFLEKANYARKRGLDPDAITAAMVWKVPRKPIGQALVITTLDEFFDVERT